MIDQQAVRQWHRDRRRPLQILGVLLGVVVLLGCAERLHESIGTWGVFVFWAVAGLNAAAWPLAFLVIEIGRAPRGGRAVLATALGITLSSLGLLLVGWGLVMVLAPEYTVGWYLPARGGNGTEIRDATGARSAGRLMTLVGAVGSLLAVALAVAVGDREPEAHDATTRRQQMRRMRNRETRGEGRLPSLAATLGANAGIAMLACGGLFWLVALGIGLISMIQYRGVRERLAECLPGIRSCSTEVWVANELPWVLALGSALALLMLGVVLRRTP